MSKLRARFRFSVRRMLVAIVLCAIALTIDSQWLTVHRRRSFLNALRADPRILDVSLESDYLYGTERLEGRGFSMPTIRRWLGDEGVLSVTIAGEPTLEEKEQIKHYLPEARVSPVLRPEWG
jgi:hypothetical protein